MSRDFSVTVKLWLKIAFLFLTRSKRSSLVLCLMVLTAVTALIFLASLAEGVNDAMIHNSIGIYSGHISGIELPIDLDKDKLMIKGVSGVLKRVAVRGMMSGNRSFDAVTLIEVDPAGEAKFTALWKKTIWGSYLDPDKRQVYLSKKSADLLQVKVGDQVGFSSGPSIRPLLLPVVGIFETGIDLLDRGVAFCPQGTLPLSAKTCEVAVFLEDGRNPDEVISRFSRMIEKGSGRFEKWSDRMPDLKQLIDLNYVSMNIVIIIVFGVVSLGIACAFTIFILKNLREYGIMKAMGVMPYETVFLVCSEVLFISLAAAAAGMICGALAVWIGRKIGIDLTRYTSHNPYFVVSGMIYPRLTSYSLWVPPVSAFLFSLLSSVWPAFFISRKNTVDIIRSR
jgi:ABC-type lipoprotein release transport system permease subunit